MNTNNYINRRRKEKQIDHYYKNAELIIKIYELTRKENALIVPRLPKDDLRCQARRTEEMVYRFQPSILKNLLSEFHFDKYVIIKFTAELFRKGQRLLNW